MGKKVYLYRMSLILCLVLCGYGASHWRISYDCTRTKANSLSKTTHQILSRLNAELVFEINCFDPDAKADSQQLLSLIAKHYPKTQIRTIEPELGLKMPQLGPQFGFIHIGYNEQSFNLSLETPLSEERLSEALYGLLQTDPQWIVWAKRGDSELFAHSAQSFSHWLEVMERMQLKNVALDLNQLSHGLPNNTRVLILSGFDSPPSFKEMLIITQYLSEGGSLLWLIDEPAEFDAWAALTQYCEIESAGQQPITKPIQGLLNQAHYELVLTQGLRLKSSQDRWTATPILKTSTDADSWFAGLYLQEKPRYAQEAPAKAVILGNSQFLRNSGLPQGQNLLFAKSLIHELTKTWPLHWAASTLPTDIIYHPRAYYKIIYQIVLPIVIPLGLMCYAGFCSRRRDP